MWSAAMGTAAGGSPAVEVQSNVGVEEEEDDWEGEAQLHRSGGVGDKLPTPQQLKFVLLTPPPLLFKWKINT